jgi:hypothetical protein
MALHRSINANMIEPSTQNADKLLAQGEVNMGYFGYTMNSKYSFTNALSYELEAHVR